MKNDKSRRKNHDEYEDEDMEYRTSHKKSGPRRRPPLGIGRKHARQNMKK
jgi:hypothetical protein